MSEAVALREAKAFSRAVRRVLVLSHMFPHVEQPGSGPFVLAQVAALREHERIDVRVISCRPFRISTRNPAQILRSVRSYRGELAQLRWAEWSGVPVLYPPYIIGRLFPFWAHAATYRRAVHNTFEHLRRDFHFDLVHAPTRFPAGHAGLALPRPFAVPLVITEHTGPFTVLTGKPIVRQIALRSLQRADLVLCVSDSLRREVCSYYPPGSISHVETLSNGVDTTLFRPPEKWAPDPARP